MPLASSLAGPANDAGAVHEQPLHRQLYLRLREAILSGSLSPGQRLASTRALAAQMGIARNTVLQAYARLEVEGYLKTERGSGHYVSPLLPARPTSRLAPPAREDGVAARSRPRLGNAYEFVPNTLRRSIPAVPFRINYPALDAFPIDTWMRLHGAVLREARAAGRVGELLGEADAHGDAALRRAIAEHASIARGVRCDADSIVITAGAQHAIDLLLRVLTRPGDAVGLEDPCFPGALAAVRASACRPIALPVDAQGPDITAAARALTRDLRALLVCPSKQFPLGVTMSLPRRLALIDWARRCDAWIIEDDYDSEYRFDGAPIPSLQGLEGGERAIYVGTFSKVLFPALRVGFIVCPASLVEPIAAARAVSGRHGSTLEQRVLARFIADGHLARHVRRMRAMYEARQAVLVHACREHLSTRVRVEPTASGLQTLAWLPEGIDDAELARRARDAGVEVAPLSRFTLHAPRPPALLLGFGGFDAPAIEAGVATLASLVDACEAAYAARRARSTGRRR